MTTVAAPGIEREREGGNSLELKPKTFLPDLRQHKFAQRAVPGESASRVPQAGSARITLPAPSCSALLYLCL